jgi:hypothetical protein
MSSHASSCSPPQTARFEPTSSATVGELEDVRLAVRQPLCASNAGAGRTPCQVPPGGSQRSPVPWSTPQTVIWTAEKVLLPTVFTSKYGPKAAVPPDGGAQGESSSVPVPVPVTVICPAVVVGLLPLTVCPALKLQIGAGAACAGGAGWDAPLQAPLAQVWPKGQSALVQQPPAGTQVPLQDKKPVGQAVPQTPLTQVATPPGGAEQTLPQWPQLFGSLMVFAQAGPGRTSTVQAPKLQGTP